MKPTIPESGTYAKKQIFCKDRIIAWSHRSRFDLARELVQPYAGGRLLDYGCGDGSFLALVKDLFPSAVGADIDPKQRASCTSFRLTEELRASEFNQAFQVITCMEVIEHCTPERAEAVLEDLSRLLAPGGTLIVSVPVEVGPSLLIKEAVRTVAAWRKLGDYEYKEKYTLRELLKMTFAGRGMAIERPVYRADFSPDRPNFYHGHKGFNWRALKGRLEERFTVRETRFSPLGWLGGLFSSQAWFICGPK